jgi:acyl carrier protein
MTSATFDVLRERVARDHGRDPATLSPDTPLAELAMDSLALIELIFTLEEHFGVAAENVPADLPTLGSVAEYIDGLVAARDAIGATGTT